MEASYQFAEKLKNKRQAILRAGLNSFYGMMDPEYNYNKAIDYLLQQIVVLLSSDDYKEGTTAFLEKREPSYGTTAKSRYKEGK